MPTTHIQDNILLFLSDLRNVGITASHTGGVWFEGRQAIVALSDTGAAAIWLDVVRDHYGDNLDQFGSDVRGAMVHKTLPADLEKQFQQQLFNELLQDDCEQADDEPLVDFWARLTQEPCPT